MLVTGFGESSGAEDAGLKTGDIITQIDTTPITDFADLSIAIGSKRPGDKVTVTYQKRQNCYNDRYVERSERRYFCKNQSGS